MGDKIDKILKGMEGGSSATGRTISEIEEEEGSRLRNWDVAFRFGPN